MRTIAIALGLILAALYLWAVASLTTSRPTDLVWTVAPARSAPLSWGPGSAVPKQGCLPCLDVWTPDDRGGAVLLTVSRRQGMFPSAPIAAQDSPSRVCNGGRLACVKQSGLGIVWLTFGGFRHMINLVEGTIWRAFCLRPNSRCFAEARIVPSTRTCKQARRRLFGPMKSSAQHNRITRAKDKAGGWRPLGRLVGINAGTLQRIANGSRKPSKSLRAKLVAVGLFPKPRTGRVRINWRAVALSLIVHSDQLIDAIEAQGIKREAAEKIVVEALQ